MCIHKTSHMKRHTPDTIAVTPTSYYHKRDITKCIEKACCKSSLNISSQRISWYLISSPFLSVYNTDHYFNVEHTGL